MLCFESDPPSGWLDEKPQTQIQDLQCVRPNDRYQKKLVVARAQSSVIIFHLMTNFITVWESAKTAVISG